MKPERRIYVVGGDTGYCSWIECEIVRRMEDASLVMFTGGEDISASLYGKKAHPTTYSSMARDRYEIAEFEKAKGFGLPMIGICRGSQFLCAVNGGILVQDQKHPYLHLVTTNDGREIRMTSTHHQRQYIKEIEDKVELLAWANHLSPYSYGETNNDKLDEDKEAEIVFYKGTMCLAIQSHPELVFPPREEWERDYIEYCRELIVKYLE